MIDTDKMRAALAATPLCQRAWTKKDDEGNKPTMLCAVSAMVSFAGVQPDLIDRMASTTPDWFDRFAAPVLEAEYDIPYDVAARIPGLFDNSDNEWRGVTEVLAMCEEYNMAEMHAEAIIEDRILFPQHTCVQQSTMRSLTIDDFSFSGSFKVSEFKSGWVTFEESAAQASDVLTSFAMEKVLTVAPQKNAPWLGKKHKHAQKALGH